MKPDSTNPAAQVADLLATHGGKVLAILRAEFAWLGPGEVEELLCRASLRLWNEDGICDRSRATPGAWLLAMCRHGANSRLAARRAAIVAAERRTAASAVRSGS